MLQLIIKTPIEMQTFNDGILKIYETDENGDMKNIPKIGNVRFSNRVIGAKRYFAAAQAQIEFSDLVRIPLITTISNYDVVVMSGYKYEIKQIQCIYDSNPPCVDLTLRILDMFKEVT